MSRILYIDACINRKTSRTERLAQAFLHKLSCSSHCEIETLILENLDIKPLDAKALALREAAIAGGDDLSPEFELARKFSRAEELLISAPYWDFSFPSSVKVFFENVCVNGLTFRYTENGSAEGLTGIRRVTYITTAGGYIGNHNLGYEYLKTLFIHLFGIKQVEWFYADGLDIAGNDPDKIIQSAIERLSSRFETA